MKVKEAVFRKAKTERLLRRKYILKDIPKSVLQGEEKLSQMRGKRWKREWRRMKYINTWGNINKYLLENNNYVSCG